MKLLSYSHNGRPAYGVVAGDAVVDLSRRLPPDCATLAALLESGRLDLARDFAAKERGDVALAEVEFLPPVPRPGKILCIGINYPDRNAEYKDGIEAPKYPSLFMRTRESLVGHRQPIVRPLESEQLDYEGEIALVIGKAGRRIPASAALAHVAGITCMNEGTIRDWIRHGKFNVTQGKNFARTGSIGPWLLTADEVRSFADLRVTTRVNGEVRQDDTTARLIFPFARLIEYVSTFLTLEPGDVIATGTPTGAGARFDPPRYLKPGDVLEIEVTGVGTLSNTIVDEREL
jgi:2-keto-4-pentenoate hydratase/2-oxohepta-3-ene-1,7-dioic acid hydratase in catechol pathway